MSIDPETLRRIVEDCIENELRYSLGPRGEPYPRWVIDNAHNIARTVANAVIQRAFNRLTFGGRAE
jgi:hypothetical protein